MNDLLDLVEQRLALLAVGLARLLLEQRVDVGIASVGPGAVTRVDLRHPGGGIAIQRARNGDSFRQFAAAHTDEELRRFLAGDEVAAVERDVSPGRPPHGVEG